MMNSNSSGRGSPPEPSAKRPEPREPRPETRSVTARIEPRVPESRPAEARTNDSRAAEVRAAEARPAEVRQPEAAARPSVLGPTLRFRGELSAQEDLIVQGGVEGTITHTQTLTIGTDGTMKGDIRARIIIVDGRVEGDLHATDSVNIRATAKVKGNIFSPRIAIADGAFFQGQIEMQPPGAPVQEHTVRIRQLDAAAPSSTSAQE